MKDKVNQYDLLEERLNSIDKATALQAKEYERRLEDLNGEAKRLQNMKNEFTPREVFDRMIDPLIQFKTKQEGRGQLKEWIPWIIALAALLWSFFKPSK